MILSTYLRWAVLREQKGALAEKDIGDFLDQKIADIAAILND